ncbi:unnamed protein product, partial [Allacma fusca]
MDSDRVMVLDKGEI